MEAFVGFKKQIPTHTFSSFFVEPTQGCHKLLLLQGDQELPNHSCRPLLALKGMVVLVVWYSYLCELGTLS